MVSFGRRSGVGTFALVLVSLLGGAFNGMRLRRILRVIRLIGPVYVFMCSTEQFVCAAALAGCLVALYIGVSFGPCLLDFTL